MDHWIKFAWILFTAINTLGLNAAQTRETHCSHHELMSCGSIEKPWDICEPRTANVRRIVSAHLDIRYDTRNCRRYGIRPHNFGLTVIGRSVWTVNGCFGSFLLCLEIDNASSNNNTMEVDNYSSDINDIRGDHFQTSDHTLGNSAESGGDTDVIDDQDTSTNIEAVDPGNVMYDNDTMILSRVHNDTDVPKTAEKKAFIQHEESSMSSIKYWIMGCIIGGGVIIVCLIAVMAYLCSCSDSQDDGEDQKTSRTTHTGTKYFRQKKWSIAPLMSESSRTISVTSSTIPSSPTLRTDDYKDVYDFIPADITSNNNNTKVKNDMEVNATLQIVDETDSNSLKHDYFVLIPESVSDNDQKSVKPNATDVENEYDHLIHNPKHTMVDSSTYNHIDFKTGAIHVDGESDVKQV